MELLIKQNYMTNNDCYRTGQKIKPIGVMVHSDGCRAGIKANGWYSRWNKPGIEACVHAFVDDKECIEYLPTEKNNCHRAWHGGGSSNNTHIGFEMCEPTDYTDSDYFKKVYKNAVEYTAYLLKKHEITVVNENTVLCHCEGYKKGIATNHGDVMHWFKYHNKTMDDFRNDVRNILNGSSTQIPSSNQNQYIKVGSKVRVVGSNYATGQSIPSWVKSNTYTVQQVNGDKCLLKEIVSWVYIRDLQIVSSGNTATSTPTQPKSKRYAENGTFYFDTAVTVRTAPEENAKTNAVYYPGEHVIYHHVIVNKNGFNWIEYARNNGTTGYLKVKDLSTGESYGSAK